MTTPTPTDLPEALRLANALAYCDSSVASQAAAELRRLHSAISAAAPAVAPQAGAERYPAEPTPDELRAIAREARNSSGSASDDCGPAEYVLHGWRAATAALRARGAVPSELHAVLRYERNKPGNENEMPRVVSCNWLPDGEYPVYLAPAAPMSAQPTDAQSWQSDVSAILYQHERGNSSADWIADALRGIIARWTAPQPPAALPGMSARKLLRAFWSGYHKAQTANLPVDAWAARGLKSALEAATTVAAAPPGEQDAARLEFAMIHGQPMERDGWFRYHGFVEQGWFGTKLEALDAAIAAKGRTDGGEPNA